MDSIVGAGVPGAGAGRERGRRRRARRARAGGHRGGGHAGTITDFFARKTRAPLTERFAPLVAQATRRHALAEQYNALAGRAAAAGLLGERRASVEAHVTAHALDALYHTIGEEERRLRRDPAAAGSALLRRVFGR